MDASHEPQPADQLAYRKCNQKRQPADSRDFRYVPAAQAHGEPGCLRGLWGRFVRFVLRRPAPVRSRAVLPASCDVAAGTVKLPAVIDQGALGSCQSASSSTALRFAMRKAGLPDYPISILFLYYHARLIGGFPADQDTGAYLRDVMKGVATYDAPDNQYWIYGDYMNRFKLKPSTTAYSMAKKVSGFRYLAVDVSELAVKSCLAEGYPIVFGTDIYDSFCYLGKDGVVPMPKPGENCCGGHALLLVGYNDATRLFKVMNTWSSSWGAGGYCYMPYAYVLDTVMSFDFWTVRGFR